MTECPRLQYGQSALPTLSALAWYTPGVAAAFGRLTSSRRAIAAGEDPLAAIKIARYLGL